jgi:hypothetical protein
MTYVSDVLVIEGPHDVYQDVHRLVQTHEVIAIALVLEVRMVYV